MTVKSIRWRRCHLHRHRMLTRREDTITGLGNVLVSGIYRPDGVHGNLQKCETEAGCVPPVLCLYGGRGCEIPKLVRQSAPDDCETGVE